MLGEPPSLVSPEGESSPTSHFCLLIELSIFECESQETSVCVLGWGAPHALQPTVS